MNQNKYPEGFDGFVFELYRNIFNGYIQSYLDTNNEQSPVIVESEFKAITIALLSSFISAWVTWYVKFRLKSYKDFEEKTDKILNALKEDLISTYRDALINEI